MTFPSAFAVLCFVLVDANMLNSSCGHGNELLSVINRQAKGKYLCVVTSSLGVEVNVFMHHQHVDMLACFC